MLYGWLRVFCGAQNILFVDMGGDYMGVHFMQNSLYLFALCPFLYLHYISQQRRLKWCKEY